jgi:hypothetical protein
MTRPADAPEATKAVQYISRSKLFGQPLQAAYPIAVAIDGAITKKVNKMNPSSIQRPALDSMVLEE